MRILRGLFAGVADSFFGSCLVDTEPELAVLRKFFTALEHGAFEPMNISRPEKDAAAAALIERVACVERHLASSAYTTESAGFVVRGVPWKSEEDVLRDLHATSTPILRRDIGVDGRDDGVVSSIIDALNPRELIERLARIIDRPATLLDPWMHIKNFLRKTRPGLPSDDEVGAANAALSQIYQILSSILGVAVRGGHDAVHFTVFGYEKAGECFRLSKPRL